MSYFPKNKIIEENSEVLVSDTGSNGAIFLKTDGNNRWEVTNNGHLLPQTNDTYDIGSAERKVRDFYLSNNSLHIGSDATNTYKLGKDENNNLTWTVNSETDILAISGDGLQVYTNDGNGLSESLLHQNKNRHITWYTASSRIVTFPTDYTTYTWNIGDTISFFVFGGSNSTYSILYQSGVNVLNPDSTTISSASSPAGYVSTPKWGYNKFVYIGTLGGVTHYWTKMI